MGIGLVVLSSASQSIAGDPYYYVKKQAVFVGIGLAAAMLIMRYDYSQLRRYSIILYGLSIFSADSSAGNGGRSTWYHRLD